MLTGIQEKNDLADYIAMLYHKRKQDSLFFIGTQNHKDFIELLLAIVPEMFRSDCPIFVPMEYSNSVELRLDHNIVFFEDNRDEGYQLVDKFAVQGDPVIALGMGTWDRSNGVKLEKKI